MAWFSRAWNRQPPGEVAALPITVGAENFAASRWVSTGAPIVNGPGGSALSSNGSSTYASTEAVVNFEPPLWIAASYTRTVAPTAGNFIAGLGQNAASGSLLGFRVASTQSGVNVALRKVAGGTLLEVGTGSTAIGTTSGFVVNVVGVFPTNSSADAYLYINGVKYNNAVTSGTLTGTAADSAFAAVGALRRDTVSLFTAVDSYMFAYGRAIEEEQARDLSSNPWQLFSPRRIWVPQTIAGGVYTLNAETGAYTFTGSNATLLHNYNLTLESASYSLTGSNASLLKGLILDAASGSYTLTGNDATLVYNKLLNASSGSYSLAGADANLIYTPTSGAYVLNAGSGAYVLTGSDVTFAYSGGLVTLKAGSWIRYRIIT